MSSRSSLRGCFVSWVILGLGAMTPPATACSTFCMNTEIGPFFGKNYDWSIGQGMLIVNPRNLQRVATVSPEETPARWNARFGSVTFNQYGRDFPMGGINEAGLVVELMWLDGTRYPTADDRGAVGELQWIQYQLDTAATVAEVLASDDTIRVAGGSPLHYLVADADGQVAVVEFLEGRMVAHQGADLPAPALTNDTYDSSLAYLEDLDRSHRPTPPGPGSANRFVRAARRTRAFRGGDREEAFRYAFQTLDLVAQSRTTQWSIVYDLQRRELRFRTHAHRGIRRLSLADLDFSCAGVVKVLLLDRDLSGDVVESLFPYTFEQNRALIGSSFAGTPFLAKVPAATLDRRAHVPERAVCLN